MSINLSISKTALAAILALGVFAGPASAGFKWVKTEKEYRERVVGKKVSNETGWSIIKTNGAMTGKFGKKKFRGKWVWSGKYWCRNGIVDKKELGTNCQKVEIDGNQMRLTRDKGKGKVTVWTIQ